jgi:hypothetical protein
MKNSELRYKYCEGIWRHGTTFPPCAIAASVAAFPNSSGTAAKCPYCINHEINDGKLGGALRFILIGRVETDFGQ